MRDSLLSCIFGVSVLTSCVLGETIMQKTCDGSNGHQAIIQPDADAFMLGYFAFHEPAPGAKAGCGATRDTGTHNEMQSYEAIRWVLDRLNKQGEVLNGQFLDNYYIPGVKIGMKVRDYCASPYADLGLGNEFFQQFSASERECTKDNTTLLLGMVGMSTSDHTTMLAKFAEDLNLPLVSFQATAPVLSDTEVFPNFMRTIPPDGPLTDTIVRFINYLDWKYVVVVFTDDTYGNGAYREIRPQLAAAGICLTAAVGVNPSDTSDEAINNILSEVMETDTVGVIYLGNGNIIDAILNMAENLDGAGKLQWVVTDSISISSSFPGQKYPRGLISVLPSNRKIIEFEDHWVRIDVNNPSQENPWYRQQYMKIHECDLPGMAPVYNQPCESRTETQRRNAFVQDQFVEPAVHAVFTYARALKNAHNQLCGGQPGMCAALRELKTMDFYNTYMRQLSFTYGKAERVESLASFSLDPYNAAATVEYDGNDLVNPSFQIYNFNDYPFGDRFKFQGIGSYINGLLEVIDTRMRFYDEPRTSRLDFTPASTCPTTPCSPCLGALVSDKYVYLPGDIVIQAAFSLHEPGDSPFTCGDFYEGPDQGVQYMQAFIFAVQYVNDILSNISGRLKGVTLGALAFDDCMNPVKSNQFITEVQRYGRQIRDENGENLLDPRTVEVYLGGQGHESLAVSMADLMNTIKKPMIGVDTYTAVLNDMENYPNFIRAQYDIEHVARAIVNVAKRYGWKYLQSVYNGDMYGEEANSYLRRVAAEEGICIVASYKIEDDTAYNTVKHIQSRADVEPIVTLLGYEDFRNFLSGVKMANATRLQLITVSGNTRAYIQGYEGFVENMIGISLYVPSLVDFETHLKDLDVFNYKTNPWIQEWFENYYDCAINPTGSQIGCPLKSMFNDDFIENMDVGTVINSVYAIMYGLHETLQYYCTDGTQICGNFTNAHDKSKVLMQKILEVNFDAEGKLYKYMYEDKMGNIPFIYHIYFDGSFTRIGTYEPARDFVNIQSTGLFLKRPLEGVRSTCAGVCMECLYLFRYQKIMYVPGDLIVPGIFDIHSRGDSPYSCSDFKADNGFLYSEAFRFALTKINRGDAPVKLNNVTLGGLGFDGCTDPIRASAIVTGIYSGAIPRPETDLDKIDVNMDELMGWMSYDSASTISMATILQRFGIPSITAGATSPVLDDKSKFTTFFRTIPSDGLIAEAMAKLARRLGFSYIITLNAPEDGSHEGVNTFRRHAEDLGICIGASYEFETDGDAKKIMQYILQSTTSVVVVFSSPDDHIVELLNEKKNNPEADKLIFITNQPWTEPVAKSNHIPVSTISFMTKYEDNRAKEQFMVQLSQQVANDMHPNPWMSEFHENINECNLVGTYSYERACQSPYQTDQSQIPNDVWLVPTMNAVYALAEGIHRTLKEKCGDNYSGICAAFISEGDTFERIMQHMDELTFQITIPEPDTFRFVEREAINDILFSRFQESNFEMASLGSFGDGELSFLQEELTLDRYENVAAACIGQCLQCERDMMGEEHFMYTAGQVHIAALFDIHLAGSTPYTCGEINGHHGYQLLEAFNWALDYVNSKKGMFNRRLIGITIGSLVFDTCSSPVRAGNLVANYHARNLEVRTSAFKIDPSLIDLYIGPMTSEASVRVADILAEIGIPQISYGASSLQLRDQRKYKYFLRTVPADDKQARAIISFLKKYELDNIQLISQFSSVGEYGREEFLRLAELNRICVMSDTVIGQDGPITDEEATQAVLGLISMRNSSTVVIIMDDPYSVLSVANRYDFIVSDFSFIATDKWGFGISGFANLENLDNLITKHKVVTFDVETADYPELDLYLENKTPSSFDGNPWFKDYYEYVYQCSLSGPTTKYPNPCPELMMGYPRAEKYIQDPYALYVINAVFAAALGIDAAQRTWCPPNEFCQILRDNGERREIFLDHIKEINFIDQTKQPFYFTPQGESDRGFHAYEPQNIGMSLHETDEMDYYWEDIGSYNDTHYLKMDATYKPNMFSPCLLNGERYCTCEFPAYQPSRYMSKPSPQDLNIAFISDIHHGDPDNNQGCGAIDTGSSMQNLFAFLYAINSVNENADSRFTGSLKLGGVALDTCSQPNRIGQDVYSLLSGEPVCGEANGQQVVPPSSIMAYMVRNSPNSIAASSMLSPLKITSLSMSATSTELNDRIEHSYFLRTVPPDNVQALIVAQILDRFGWDYVQIVYADNSYGRSAVETLLRTSNPASPKYCFGRTIAMSVNSDLTEAKTVIDKLNSKIGARVVVTFVSGFQVTQLLQATSEKGLKNRFLWIGSDTWANNYLVTKGYEEPALGAITIQIRSEYSQSFRDYVKSITLNDRKGIPDDWFEEIFQTVHECRILDSPIQKTYTRICTGDEVFTDEMIPQDPYVLHTIISVFQIAHGLNDIEACKKTGLTIASCLALQDDRKQLIYDSILAAQHDVLPEDLGDNSFNFKFTADGYGDIGYNIYNFQTNLATSQYEYVQIGSSSGDLRLDTRNYRGYSYTDRTLPSSRCPIGSTCQCFDANGESYPFSRDTDGYIVTEEGKYLDPMTGQMVTIEDEPGTSARFRDIWALIVVTLAAIGAFSSLCLFIYLLVVYPVRGGTTILGYMLGFGIILQYVLVFAFIVHATQEICALRRFCLGFVYSICYGAIFVKLVDCWRTRTKEDIYMVKYNKIGNPWGLFFSACLIVIIQVMINAEWLILENPNEVKVIYNNMLWPRCTPDDFYDEGLILSNLFVMFVIFLSVLIGVAAFGNDKNHWDTRWLLGCVVLTIPCWMVWCIVAALGEYKMRDAAVAIGLLYNASVMLLCGPMRKLYLLNKYQAKVEEEERKSQIANSTRDYNSMYSRQYDNAPRLHDGDSNYGSPLVAEDEVFMYEPKS